MPASRSRLRRARDRARVVAVLVAVTASSSLGLAVAAGPATRAATAQSPEPVRAWLYTDRVTWHTVPGTRVAARMVDRRAGEDSVEAVADADGNAVLSFGAAPHDRIAESSSNPALIEPGDKLTVEADGRTVWTITVPALSADATAAPGRVDGTAPAGTAVDIAIQGEGRAPFAGTATAGADGRFEIDLAGRFELQHGDVGWATSTGADGHSFSVLFTPLSVEVTLGSPRFRVRSSTSPVSDAEVQLSGAPDSAYALWIADDPFVSGWSVYEALDDNVEPASIRAGSVIKVTQFGPPLRADRVQMLTVPEVSLEIDAARATLQGRVPPGGGVVRVAVRRPGDAAWQTDAVVGADGTFSVAVPAPPLPPGSSAELRHDDGGGHTFIARTFVPQLTVRPTEGLVDGITQPNRPVTVTVTGRQLPAPSTFRAQARHDGTFSMRLVPGGANAVATCSVEPWCGRTLRLGAGDGISATIDLGDQRVLTLPHLSTRTDPDTETVGGHAPPGAAVVIYGGLPWPLSPPDAQVNPAAPPAVRWATVTADAAGRFSATLGPTRDIEPPQSGYAVIDVGGIQVAAAWRPMVVRFTQDGTWLDVDTAAGQPISATLRDPLGGIVRRWGQSLGRVHYVSPNAAAGDVLHVSSGDDSTVLSVPGLDVAFDVTADTIIGHGPPGAELTLRVNDALPLTVTVGADGLFRRDMRVDGMDLRYYDRVQADLAWGPGQRHTFSRSFTQAGLVLDLESSRLSGWRGYGLEVTFSATRDGRLLSRQTARGEGQPEWYGGNTILRDTLGQRIVLLPGDVIATGISRSGLDPTRAMTLTVPNLRLEAQPASNVVSGEGPPGASLRIDFSHVFIWSGDARPLVSRYGNTVTVASDGRWSTAITDYDDRAADIRPGSFVGAQLQLADGHLVQTGAHLPLLSAEVDGTWVCGLAAPFAPVTVTAHEIGGTLILSGAATASEYGGFAFPLADLAGGGRTMSPGTVVSGRLGAADVVLTVPPLGVAIDWRTGAVDVTTSPLGEVTLDSGAHGCLGRGTNTNTFAGQRYQRADANGRAAFTGDDPDAVAAGVVAAAYTATGMRVYRDAGRPIADLHVGTPRLVVTATARTALRATLLGADGRTVAAADGIGDHAGRLDLAFVDVAGRAVPMREGQQVSLDEASASTTIAVEPLSIDVSAAHGLSGRAAPDRDVDVRLVLRDGRNMWIDRRSDGEGRFALTADMLSVREHWRWADVRRFEVGYALPGGHRVIVDDVLAAAGPAGRIVLPFADTGSRR